MDQRLKTESGVIVSLESLMERLPELRGQLATRARPSDAPNLDEDLAVTVDSAEADARGAVVGVCGLVQDRLALAGEIRHDHPSRSVARARD